jgi:hypothetical protein
MAAFSHHPVPDNLHPDVQFDDSRGLILSHDGAEHRVFNPSLDNMLRRYRECPESRAAAREWLAATNTYSPFGFVPLCEYLELDPNYVRRGLIRWMDEVDRGGLLATMRERGKFSVSA